MWIGLLADIDKLWTVLVTDRENGLVIIGLLAEKTETGFAHKQRETVDQLAHTEKLWIGLLTDRETVDQLLTERETADRLAHRQRESLSSMRYVPAI